MGHWTETFCPTHHVHIDNQQKFYGKSSNESFHRHLKTNKSSLSNVQLYLFISINSNFFLVFVSRLHPNLQQNKNSSIIAPTMVSVRPPLIQLQKLLHPFQRTYFLDS